MRHSELAMLIKGIQVKLDQAEKVRKYLFEKHLIRNDFKIERDDKFVYFPVRKITDELDSYKPVEKNFKKINKNLKSYKEILLIPDNTKQELPTSFDIIGNIILIKLENNLLNYKKKIGESLLQSNRNIKTVCLIRPVEGELRIRDLEVIAGEKRTTTFHKEYNLEFEVDISKTYFSPRLSSERKRIADLVKPNEIIVDMFAGVGPFSIMIAKYAHPKIIYALDKNKYAIIYAKRNIKKNNLLDKIEVIHTDAKQIQNILNQKKQRANRIIMNLPFSAYEFYPIALQIMANTCVIHYFDILYEDEISERIKNLIQKSKEFKIEVVEAKIRKIKSYSPREFYIGIDITAKRKNYADVA